MNRRYCTAKSECLKYMVPRFNYDVTQIYIQCVNDCELEMYQHNYIIQNIISHQCIVDSWKFSKQCHKKLFSVVWSGLLSKAN